MAMSLAGIQISHAVIHTCVDKHNRPMPNGASVDGHVHVPQDIQWLWTIRNENAFETLSVMLSSLAMQHEHRTKVWLPLLHPTRIQPTGKAHVRNISRHFRGHVWSGGEPVGTRPRFQERPVVACYDSASSVGSFDFMRRFASEPALRAVASLQAASARWFGVSPRPPPPAALARGGAGEAAASSPRVAVLLQRWPTARIVVNSNDLLSLLSRRGWVAHSLVPERVPLSELVALLRTASILITIHGAGMINQIFLPLRRAAVVEAFLPHMIYTTGPQLSNICGFRYMPIFLRWTDASPAPLTDDASYTGNFGEWRGWGIERMRNYTVHCARRRLKNLMTNSICLGVAKSLDYILPLDHIDVLLLQASTWLDQPLAPLPWISPSGTNSCVQTVALVEEADQRGERSPHRLVTVGRTGLPEQARSWLLPLLRSTGFCVAHHSETRDADLVIRVRSAMPAAEVLHPLLADAEFSPDAVIIDFLVDSVVARRDSEDEVRVRNATSSNRVHMTYFCTPERADTAPGQPHLLFVELLASDVAQVEPGVFCSCAYYLCASVHLSPSPPVTSVRLSVRKLRVECGVEVAAASVGSRSQRE